MILTKEFLDSVGSCEPGHELAVRNGYYGMDYDEVIKDLVRLGDEENAKSLIYYKTTAQYVRATGSEITVAYNVTNPITGFNIQVDTLEELRALVVDIEQQILAHTPMTFNEIVTNENGDTSWTAVERKDLGI